MTRLSRYITSQIVLVSVGGTLILCFLIMLIQSLRLVDLIVKPYTGKDADAALGEANITVNKNAVPNDPRSPFITSGLRVGTPAITTRGFEEAETKQLAGWMCDILDDIGNESTLTAVKQEVLAICRRLPVYEQ